MKTLKHLFTALLLMVATVATAHDFEVDGIYYAITSYTHKTVEVTFRGVSSDSYSNEYTGRVDIPSSVISNGITYAVTSIGVWAFYGCSGLTSIEIPGSVTSIGEATFQGCTGLTNVTIPNSVTSIGESAFQNCKGLTSITIPNSVASIGNSAFYGCYGLTNIVVDEGNSVYDSRDNCNAIIITATNRLIAGCRNTVIPNSVTSIGNSAFNNCIGLTSITIPNSVTNIGNSAFNNCTGLTNVTIPNSVASIGNYAFNNCSGLTSIEIPNSVTSIGNYAFERCTGLTSITISNSVTSIGNSAFYGCSGLTSIEIPGSVTTIGESAFKNCTGLKEVYISDLVAWCGIDFENYNSNPLYYAHNLYLNRELVTELVISNGVNEIKQCAFSGCTGLASITISNSVTSIGNSAFYGCSGLTSIEIPGSVTSIGEATFQGCTGLTNVTIPNSVTGIGNYSFNGCEGLKAVVNFSNLTFTKGSSDYGYIAYYADNVYNAPNGSIEEDYIFGKPNEVNTLLYYLGNRNELNLPVDYKGENYVIGDNVFKNYTTLESITIPNSVTSIGEGTFDGCTGLTSVTIPNSVTRIGKCAFRGCSGLASVTIGNSVTSIGISAFSNCSRLTSITIPNSVTTIGNYAFERCTGLTSVTIGNSVTSIGYDVFYGCSGLTSITIPNSVTSIGNSAFSGCTGLTSVTIPNSVTNIENYAFYNCTGLTSVTIPNSVTSIGDGAFSGCSGLASVTIGNSVTSIGYSTFNGCKGLTSITIPNSVTSIGNYAFKNCTGLTSITIPNSVTSIRNYAFDGCTGLTSIISMIPADKLFISEYLAFNNIDKTKCTLYVPFGAKETYATTDGWKDFVNIVEIVKTFQITFFVDDTVFATDSIAEGSQITYPDVPEKEGYTFCWDTDIDTMPSNDTTITGKYIVNSYLLTYIVDGEVYATDSIAYGATIEPLEEPTKEGHTFSGWSEIPETMPAEDITITGSFTINSYILTYIVDGEVYATDSIAYGATIEPLEEPTKEGHTFSGWSEIPAIMPAEDVTITGSFTANNYIVTFMIDGEVYDTATVEYGTEIELPTPPEKEGYIFSGWVGVPETMPAEDIVIEGSYEVDTTDINAIELDLERNEVYNLNGLRITETENLSRGFYIINGKKVYVK